jgi:amino acid transporter
LQKNSVNNKIGKTTILALKRRVILAIQPTPMRRFRDIIIGKPLATAAAPHQAIGIFMGLAVLASDALSSVGYATQEMLHILALAVPVVGMQTAFGYSIPLSFAILVLLVVLTISYRQTIFAYPDGGGSYRVSKENLGELPAQIAGAALSMDYILTVAVSISSGVAQITSALPMLHPYRVYLALAFIAFMTIVNLRGVKESGFVFSMPTYFFILITLATIGIGVFRYFTGTLGVVTDVEMIHISQTSAQGITLFLLLRAFSSGCTALTGVEAISNGVGVFKRPTSKNAATTMLMMTVLIIFLFGSITLLAHQVQAVPSETETVISQIARTVYGSRGIVYLLQMASMSAILLMAANTAYQDFPRLAALHATDGFLPRQLSTHGHRLVFSYGIVVLAVAAGLLIVVFRAEVNLLIPLYAIGVFLSFSMSDAGMAVHWWRTRLIKPGETQKLEYTTLHYDSGWRWKMLVNGFGSIMSVIVMLIFAVTKFRDGAWIVLVLVPSMVFVFFRIHHHYQDVAHKLSISADKLPIRPRPITTIVMVNSLHKAAIRACNFASSISDDWYGIHINTNEHVREKLEAKWKERLPERELLVLESPYRDIYDPLRLHIREIRSKAPEAYVQLILGGLAFTHIWEKGLHVNSSGALQNALNDIEGVAVTVINYQLYDDHTQDPENFPLVRD